MIIYLELISSSNNNLNLYQTRKYLIIFRIK